MRRIAFIAVFSAFTGVAGVATAADLGSYKDAPIYSYTPAALWTGFYVGGHIGGVRGNVDITDTYAYNSTDPVLGSSINSKGLIGGVQLGYNRQSGNIVYGLEADLGKMDISGKKSARLQNTDYSVWDKKYGYQYQLDANYEISTGLYGDVTGRLGYTTGKGLLYLKGGIAFLNADVTGSYVGAHYKGSHTFNFGESDTLTGWTIGAGFEYALTPKLSVKAEYQHFDFGSISYDHNETYSPSCAITSTLSGKTETDITADAVTVGLNYNLSGGGDSLK